MGMTPSCFSKGVDTPVQKEEDPLPPSPMMYTLYFVSASIPVDTKYTAIDKIMYAESWCLSESLWRSYIQNALREVESDPTKKVSISRLKIDTKVYGNNVVGKIKWIYKDIDIGPLNALIKTSDENLFEKGIYFIEPFWSTLIIPRSVKKCPVVSVD
jgi:hypothetical protein